MIPDDDDELVAAVAAHDVVGPHVLPAGLGYLGEYLVARDVPVRVVDLLEVVHVEHQGDERLAEPLGAREGGLGGLHEMAPVVQAGDAVDRGQLLVADRQPAVVVQGDVLARADQEGQRDGAGQDASERVEPDAAQADDGQEQVAAHDGQVGQQGRARGGGLRSGARTPAGLVRNWQAAARQMMIAPVSTACRPGHRRSRPSTR